MTPPPDAAVFLDETVEIAADLPPEIFDVKVNVPLIHQVVTAQLAAARQGTHSTKTRGEVRGAGKKPHKQKGTGRARQGSVRAPHLTGGGVVHGPQPRDYSQRTPKKMKAAALRGALTNRARNGGIRLIDFGLGGHPSTKTARSRLEHLTSQGMDKTRFLVVLARSQVVEWRSVRNLPNAHPIAVDQLNTYDIIVSDIVVFTKAAFDLLLNPQAFDLPLNPGRTSAIAEDTRAASHRLESDLLYRERVNSDLLYRGRGNEDTPSHFTLADAHEEARAMKGVISRLSKDPRIDGWSVRSDEIEYIALERHETYVLATWPSTFDADAMLTYLRQMSDKITALFVDGAGYYECETDDVDWDTAASVGSIRFVRAEIGERTLIWELPDEEHNHDNRFIVVDAVLDLKDLFPMVKRTTDRNVMELLSEVLGDEELRLLPRETST